MKSAQVVLGTIVGVYGIKGWVKVRSETEPALAILDYAPWQLDGIPNPVPVLAGRMQGRAVIACLEGCQDRDQAATFVGKQISVERTALPPVDDDEIYWVDLQGLQVVTTDGVELGYVSHLFATGANDVMVVKGERERLIPFVTEQVVQEVDQSAGLIRVDWDPEF